jgi:hypothetical protein
MAHDKKLGLAVVGCGVVGRMRSTLAIISRYWMDWFS